MLTSSLSPWPYYSEEEVEKVSSILKNGTVNYWTGVEGRAFEKEFATFHNVNFAVAVSNGTVALELSLMALNVGEGDEVIVTSRSFVASASSISRIGATPVFADVDLDSQNISAETIKPLISSKTKAVICVHLAGWPCDMDPILELAKEYDLKVIEDCAQAHGAKYKNKPVGSLGDVAAFSFCQDKIISTAGEGGMVISNSEEIYNKIWSYKDHGKSMDLMKKPNPGNGFKYVHSSIGTNYRMTEISSAIGRIQLSKLNDWVEKRRANAFRLMEVFSQFKSLRTPVPSSDFFHVYYKCYTFVDEELLNDEWNRDRIINELNEVGVPTFQGSSPEMYLEIAFDTNYGNPKDRLVNSQKLGLTSLMFLTHPTITDEQMSDVCDNITAIMKKASRE